MDAVIEKFLSELEFDKIQKFKNMAVMPLLSPQESPVVYITLKEAMETGAVSIMEVDKGGSVPDLKVINRGDFPVLLIDGEELAGAKQNRAVNTSILLKVKWEGIIPVSCTEQGRWDYVSPEFEDSKVVMGYQIRAKKAEAVERSLAETGEFVADQGEIWNEIRETADKAGAPPSPTGAMKDIFTAKKQDLNDYAKAFRPVEGQKGLLVMIDGKVTGFDIVSLESAYKVLHNKLIRSYAMGALLSKGGAKAPRPTIKRARDFIAMSMKCEGKKFKSIGHGWDYRLKGEGLVGSSLVWRKKVVHMAFFTLEEDAVSDGPMTGYRNRRGFRM